MASKSFFLFWGLLVCEKFIDHRWNTAFQRLLASIRPGSSVLWWPTGQCGIRNYVSWRMPTTRPCHWRWRNCWRILSSIVTSTTKCRSRLCILWRRKVKQSRQSYTRWVYGHLNTMRMMWRLSTIIHGWARILYFGHIKTIILMTGCWRSGRLP